MMKTAILYMLGVMTFCSFYTIETDNTKHNHEVDYTVSLYSQLHPKLLAIKSNMHSLYLLVNKHDQVRIRFEKTLENCLTWQEIQIFCYQTDICEIKLKTIFVKHLILMKNFVDLMPEWMNSDKNLRKLLILNLFESSSHRFENSSQLNTIIYRKTTLNPNSEVELLFKMLNSEFFLAYLSMSANHSTTASCFIENSKMLSWYKFFNFNIGLINYMNFNELDIQKKSPQ